MYSAMPLLKCVFFCLISYDCLFCQYLLRIIPGILPQAWLPLRRFSIISQDFATSVATLMLGFSIGP